LGDISACGIEGDWLKYVKFVEVVSRKYKHVILLTGNHEYYTTNKKQERQTMEEINDKITSLTSKFNNVYFLNNSSIVLNGITFLGTTLWSYVKPKDRSYIQKQMNDYNSIYVAPNKRLTIQDMSAIHLEAIKFLETELQKSKSPVVVLTHHKPVLSHEVDLISQAYETNVEVLQKYKHIITLTAHGHTHKQMDEIINGLRVVSMPKGYPNQHTKFKKDYTIDV